MSTASPRAQALLAQALEFDIDAWPDFVARECAADPSLAAEVEALLASAARADDYFGAFAERFGVGAVRQLGGQVVRDRIGPYEIVRVLGRGGMGTVYLGRRCDGQFEQEVAIKVVHAGFSAPGLQQQFVMERKILARLAHPNVCRLLDGGMIDEHTPYLVMEYVDGRAIDVHADEEQLGLEHRLRLLIELCAAVAWSHRHLVVHRDLKPSNVLVSREGTVKLLDFGIAKLLGPEHNDGVTTDAGFRPLTPRYASPEMLAGRPTTTATDVYGLGVLAFELLTGHGPYEGASDLQQAVLRGATGLPSERCPEPLRTRLRGDLDRILAKALEVDAADRYGSVDDLAADVQRYLEHRPISARRPTIGYRLRKLVERRRGLVAAAVAMVLSMVGLVVVGVLLMLATQRHAEEMSRERDRSEVLRQQAAEEAAAAQEVSDFLVQLFEVNVPGHADGDVSVRMLLDRGSKRIEADLEQRPVTKARLLQTMGNTYEQLGHLDDALALFERELEVLHSAEAPPSKIGAAHKRAGRVWLKKGEYERSLDHCTRALAILDGADPPNRRGLAMALVCVGWAEGSLGRYDDAHSHLERAVAIHESLPIDDDCTIGASLNGLAVNEMRRGHTKAARARYERLLMLCEPRWAKKDPRRGHALNNLAIVLTQAGELELATQTYERSLRLREQILEPDHPDIAESLSNMSKLLLAQKDYVRALESAARAAKIREAALGATHVDVASSLTNLGSALVGLGRQHDARRQLRRAIAIFERRLGRESARGTFPKLALARADAADGRWAAADARMRRVVDVRRRLLGAAHPDTRAAETEHKVLRSRMRARASKSTVAERARGAPRSTDK